MTPRLAAIAWTPTQRRMLELLADGLPHTRRELHDCLWDEASNLSAIQRHISIIRSKLRPLGQSIICEFGNQGYRYRHVILLTSSATAQSK